LFSALEALQIECHVVMTQTVGRRIQEVGIQSPAAEQLLTNMEQALWGLDCEVECFRHCLREAAIISEHVGRACAREIIALPSVEAESAVDVAAKPKHGRVRDILHDLKHSWPGAFSEHMPPIHADALAQAHENLRHRYDASSIDLALRSWCNAGRYLSALANGEEFVLLNGELSNSWPSTRERADAAVALAGYLQRRSARRD
jgi:hypothetical protein